MLRRKFLSATNAVGLVGVQLDQLAAASATDEVPLPLSVENAVEKERFGLIVRSVKGAATSSFVK